MTTGGEEARALLHQPIFSSLFRLGTGRWLFFFFYLDTAHFRLASLIGQAHKHG